MLYQALNWNVQLPFNTICRVSFTIALNTCLLSILLRMEGLEKLIERDDGSGDDGGVDLSQSSEDDTDSSVSESDSGDEVSGIEGLSVTKEEVARNYELLGSSFPPDPPIHHLEDLKQEYPFAFSELSESTLAAVLQENPVGFELSAFQVRI